MSNKGPGAGYTIVETLIVLAVSSALLASAMLLFQGQTGRTEFTQAVREFELNLQDVINDVATGYYPSNNSITCEQKVSGTPGSGIRFTNVATEQGKNKDCIFIGKVMLFGPQGTSDANMEQHGMRVYTLAGQRLIAVNKQVANLKEAKPELIAAGTSIDNTSYPDLFDDVKIVSSAYLASVKHAEGGTPTESRGIGVVSSFGKQSDQGFLLSGATNSSLVSFDSITTSRDHINFVNTLDVGLSTTDPVTITNGEVIVCLSNDPTNPTLYGKITIGGSSRQLKTTSVVTGTSYI